MSLESASDNPARRDARREATEGSGIDKLAELQELLPKLESNEEDEALNKELDKLLSECRPPANDEDDPEDTALHIAAEFGLSIAAEKLIQAGWSVAAKDITKAGPLHRASEFGHLNVVKLLLKEGADIEAKDQDAETPLHAACLGHKRDVVQFLIDKGANIEARDRDGNTPLLMACYKDNVDVVNALISKGANIVAQDNAGESPLHVASFWGHEQIVLRLLEVNKSNVNETSKIGRTALHIAIKEGEATIIPLLLNSGARLDIQDRDGLTPFMTAIVYEKIDIMDKLIHFQSGKTDTQLDERDKDDCTPLLKASAIGFTAGMSCLIKAGANQSLRNREGQTALCIAFLQDEPGPALREVLTSEKVKSVDFGTNAWRLKAIKKCAEHSRTADLVGLLFAKEMQCNKELESGDGTLSLIEWMRDEPPKLLKNVLDASLTLEATKHVPEAIFKAALAWTRVFNEQAQRQLSIERKNTKLVHAETIESPDKTNLRLVINDKADKSTKPGASTKKPQAAEADKPSPGEPPEKPGGVDGNGTLPQVLNLLLLNYSKNSVVEKRITESVLLTLDLVGNLNRDNLSQGCKYAELPTILWHLICAVQRSNEVKYKIKTTLTSVRKLIKIVDSPDPIEHRKSTKTAAGRIERVDKKERERRGGLIPDDDKLDAVQYPQRTEHDDKDMKDRNEQMKYLKRIEEILCNPFIRLQTYAETNPFEHPVPKLKDRELLNNVEISIIQFITGIEQTSRRDRTIEDVVYSEAKDSAPSQWQERPFMGPNGIEMIEMGYMSDSVNSQRPKVETEPKFTWIQVPATNMVWMNDLLTRIMKDEKYERSEYHKVSSFFRVEMPDKSSDSRFMRPRAIFRREEKTGADDGMKHASSETTDATKSSYESQGAARPNKSKIHAFVPASAIYLPYISPSLRSSQHPTFKLQDNGKHDHDDKYNERKKYEEACADYEKILKACKDFTVHQSPTIDEWYYEFDSKNDKENKGDRVKRNKSQVYKKFHDIQRNTKSNKANDLTAEPESDSPVWPVLRVNQLWVWTIANKFVITATSCLVDDTRATIVDGLLDQLSKQRDSGEGFSRLKTTDDLCRMIVDYCIGSYERQPTQLVEKPSARQAFFHYMNKIGRDESALFENFSNRISEWDKDEDKSQSQSSKSWITRKWDKFISKFRSVPMEAMRTSVKMANQHYCEIKDFRDELNILKAVAQYQQSVQKELVQSSIRDSDLLATRVLNDLNAMDLVSKSILEAVNTTLSLQQSELANSQAETATRHGQILMVFTFATLLFLPLSFLSSLFALDVDTFLQTPSWAFVVIFLGSIAISSCLGLSVLFRDEINDKFKKWLGFFKQLFHRKREQDNESQSKV